MFREYFSSNKQKITGKAETGQNADPLYLGSFAFLRFQF